jgi:sugar (pentulose or hexulose) kinase
MTESRGELVVGIDCSTTGTKAVAFTARGKVAAREFAPIPLVSPRPAFYEQDAGDWWRSVQKVLKGVAREVGPRRIRAIAIANQRETFVPLDADDRCLRPAIVWLDERCKEEVEWLSKKVGKAAIHRITGKPPDYAPVVYRLAWMKRHEPNLYKDLRMVCDVQSYIVRKLTGRWITSWASADPLGLFDMRNRKWSPLILHAIGLVCEQLPALCSPGTNIGRLTKAASESTGLLERTVVVAGGGDGQAAGLGANVLSPQRAYLNLGTAVVAGVYGINYRTSNAFRTMCSCADKGYNYECSLRSGTFAIDWFIKNVLCVEPVKQPEIYRQLEREAELVPSGSEGVLHLPYLCGVMNPFWDMNARGAFVGLSSTHHRGHLYRSILEGIALEQRSAITAVEKSLGASIREFVAIGGGATSALWCQIIADVTAKNVCIPDDTEASAMGAAIDAAVGIGWYGTFQNAARHMTKDVKTITPQPANQELYRRLFAAYKTIYPALKGAKDVPQ